MTKQKNITQMKKNGSNNIAYLCNQKQCKNCSAKLNICKHTTDIKFALNYNKIPSKKELKNNFTVLGNCFIENTPPTKKIGVKNLEWKNGV